MKQKNSNVQEIVPQGNFQIQQYMCKKMAIFGLLARLMTSEKYCLNPNQHNLQLGSI